MSEAIVIALIGALTVIVVAMLGFFFKRERELGALQQSQKAMHKRQDRMENKLNGGIDK